MRTTFPVNLSLLWWRVITAFLGVVALLWVVGLLLHGPALIVVSVITVMVWVALWLVTWRAAPVGTLLGRRLTSRQIPAPDSVVVEHRVRWSADTVAIRNHGDELVAVVVVDGPAFSPSVLDQHRVQSAATLPIHVVAEALRQFDVRLSGIDIVSAGRRRAPDPHHPYAATYSRVIGDHGAVGQRRTWCILRLNTRTNAGAVAARDSVAATLAVCAQRLAVELRANGGPARVADAAELDDFDTALTELKCQGARARWSGLTHSSGTVAAYWVSPADLSTATLDRLWAPDTDHTVTTIQLRPGDVGSVDVGALVAYSTPGMQKQPPATGLNPCTGRHDLGVRAAMPDPATPTLLAPHRRLRVGEELRAPIGATGIMLGVTAAHHPLLVTLTNPRPGRTSTVTVAGELALLVQIAQRMAASGFRVAVLTERPERWCDVTAAGLRVVTELPAEFDNRGRDVMVLYDQPHAGPNPDVAVVLRAIERGSASVADVHLEQDSSTTAVIRTAEFRYRAHIDVQAERNLITATTRRAA
jgi:type VII secretion protein EccE